MNQKLVFFLLFIPISIFLISSVLHTKNLNVLEPFYDSTRVDGAFLFNDVNVGIRKSPNKNAFIDTNGVLRVKGGIMLRKSNGDSIKFTRNDIARINEMYKTMYQDNKTLSLYDKDNKKVTITKENLGILTGQLGYRIGYSDNDEPSIHKNSERDIFTPFPYDIDNNSSPGKIGDFKFVNIPLLYRDMGPRTMAVGPKDKDYYCQISLDKDRFKTLRTQGNDNIKLKEYDF